MAAFASSRLSKLRMSLTKLNSCLPEYCMYLSGDLGFAGLALSKSSFSPMMALRGVRISWLITERKSVLAVLAFSARERACSNSVTSEAYDSRSPNLGKAVVDLNLGLMGRCEDQASAMVQRRNHAAHDVVNLDAFSDFCILPQWSMALALFSNTTPLALRRSTGPGFCM